MINAVRMCALFLSLLSTSHLSAEVLEFKPLTMELEKEDEIHIRGFDGSVKLVGRSQGRQLVVSVKQINSDKAPRSVRNTFDEWLFSLQRKGKVIEIEVRSPPSKQAWRQLLMNGGMPKFEIHVMAPAVPARIGWKSGSVEVSNWSAPLHILNEEGRTLVTGGKGPLKVVAQEGPLSVSGRDGVISLENYIGKVGVGRVKGQLTVENFAGDTVISESDAQIYLSSFRGTTEVKGGSGRVEFENERSTLKVSGFKGDLKGSSGQGAVVAQLVGDADVRVSTQEGSVSLRLPNSGASVNAGTEEGAMYLPQSLQLTRLPNLKLMRGRLHGKNKGYVHIRTKSGDIRLR